MCSKHGTPLLDNSLQFLESATRSQMPMEVGETVPILSGRVEGGVPLQSAYDLELTDKGVLQLSMKQRHLRSLPGIGSIPEAITHPSPLDTSSIRRVANQQSRATRRLNQTSIYNLQPHNLLATSESLIGGSSTIQVLNKLTHQTRPGGPDPLQLDVPVGGLLHMESRFMAQREGRGHLSAVRMESALIETTPDRKNGVSTPWERFIGRDKGRYYTANAKLLLPLIRLPKPLHPLHSHLLPLTSTQTRKRLASPLPNLSNPQTR